LAVRAGAPVVLKWGEESINQNIENCFKDDELRKRLANAKIDIWYLSSLAKNDVTKFEEVRKALFVDAMICLEKIIDLN